jgi:hypothetical protein
LRVWRGKFSQREEIGCSSRARCLCADRAGIAGACRADLFPLAFVRYDGQVVVRDNVPPADSAYVVRS